MRNFKGNKMREITFWQVRELTENDRARDLACVKSHRMHQAEDPIEGLGPIKSLTQPLFSERVKLHKLYTDAVCV